MPVLVAFLLGLAALPAAYAFTTWASWAFDKTEGTGPCPIKGCAFRGLEMGERYNVTVWLHQLPHGQSPRHRRASRAFWQEQKDQGYWVHPKVAPKLH